MRFGRIVALALVGAALACGGREPDDRPQPAANHAAQKEPSGPDDPHERRNLLNLARGATVVSRTGELTLASSAVAAIDGNLGSAWVIPPDDLPQSVVTALAARSRINRVGLATRGTKPIAVRTAVFESSLDGTTFRPLATMRPANSDEAQFVSVTPTEATTLRVTIAEGDSNATLFTLYAEGDELAPPHAPAIAGCWMVNNLTATFEQRGAHAYGSMASNNQPTLLDGGSDGRFFRFTWMRGAEFGYAAIASDGAHFSGVAWNEEPIPLFSAGGWFGERRDCPAAPLPYRGEVTRGMLARAGRAPLFGLQFDANGKLLEAESIQLLTILRAFIVDNPSAPVRFIAHEFRASTKERNLAIAKNELATLEQSLERNGVPRGRVTFVAAGSDAPREVPVTDVMRALYSSVDLEIQR